MKANKYRGCGVLRAGADCRGDPMSWVRYDDTFTGPPLGWDSDPRPRDYEACCAKRCA
jgi:hypothetical protein